MRKTTLDQLAECKWELEEKKEELAIYKVKWEAMEKQVKKIHKWAGVSIAVNEAVNKRNKKLGIDPKIN
jgi:hypothetical protein